MCIRQSAGGDFRRPSSAFGCARCMTDGRVAKFQRFLPALRHLRQCSSEFDVFPASPFVFYRLPASTMYSYPRTTRRCCQVEVMSKHPWENVYKGLTSERRFH